MSIRLRCFTTFRRKVSWICPKCGHIFGAGGRCPVDQSPLQRTDI